MSEIKYGVLHCHTEQSMRDSVLSVETLVKRAKELGAPAIALTILDRQGSTKGLFVLLCALDVREYMSENIIGYKIAPVLNAPGRLRDDGAMDAFRFMVFDGSYEDAKKMAEKILEDNVTQRFLSDKWTEHAINARMDKRFWPFLWKSSFKRAFGSK